MKYFVVAGEASGDIHGANLIHQIKKLDPAAEFQGFGGERMKAEGVTLIKELSDLAFMGFVEVVANLRTILGNLSACKKAIKDFNPDKLIVIDYPGFNIRLAKWAKAEGYEINYYISPQIWAWKENRVHTIKKVVDRMMVILPFEKDFYAKHGMEVDFVGHPLIDEIERWKATEKSGDPSESVIALLPGSRENEIKKILSSMLSVVDDFPNHKFVIGKASHLPKSMYEPFLSDKVLLSEEGSYSLLSRAEAALVTSGTATLETGLFQVPQVVCYRGNAISVAIARQIIKVKYLSLVNLILDEKVVPELVQEDLNRESIGRELTSILEGGNARQAQIGFYQKLWQALGDAGASERAAGLVVNPTSDT